MCHSGWRNLIRATLRPTISSAELSNELPTFPHLYNGHPLHFHRQKIKYGRILRKQ